MSYIIFHTYILIHYILLNTLVTLFNHSVAVSAGFSLKQYDPSARMHQALPLGCSFPWFSSSTPMATLPHWHEPGFVQEAASLGSFRSLSELPTEQCSGKGDRNHSCASNIYYCHI